ncbi:cytochrome c [Pedobacter sp. KR3-3]|uniref:Cytochrome c n=1 Tax=Pedobacter albus TaxID=3113905 RepID=A0ABU7I728_9SPHI|nr:cytochrome c [Pedobacter sp. KR3-3]MEE1945284.1 cytochrome c [Pedobacter sp. KR3-3]
MKKIACITFLLIGLLTSLNAQTKKTATAKAAGTTEPSLVNGKLLYKKYCLVCHQSDGGGVMGLNPPLIKTDYVLGDQKRLINVILKGLNQDIEIDGETYANPMPALGHLSDQEVADVLSFVRNSFGNKASVITPAQVKAVRATKK